MGLLRVYDFVRSKRTAEKIHAIHVRPKAVSGRSRVLFHVPLCFSSQNPISKPITAKRGLFSPGK